MKILQKDLYHGAALTQIVEHPFFTALNKASDKYGHYQLNHNKRLLVKYAGTSSPWMFNIQNDDISIIQTEIASDQEFYLCLICADSSVCTLSAIEIEQAIDLGYTEQQFIRVTRNPGSSMRVNGKTGALERPVPVNSFPEKLFKLESTLAKAA